MVEKMIELWDTTHRPQLRTFEHSDLEAMAEMIDPRHWRECTRCKMPNKPVAGTIKGFLGRRLPLCYDCVTTLIAKGLVQEQEG